MKRIRMKDAAGLVYWEMLPETEEERKVLCEKDGHDWTADGVCALCGKDVS